MHQWKFGGEIPRISHDPKTRILTALCVLAGSDECHFIDAHSSKSNCIVKHPLREEIKGSGNLFRIDINLPGLHGKLNFANGRMKKFDGRHKTATKLMIEILQEKYANKKSLSELSEDDKQTAMVWFCAHMHDAIRVWHPESAVHSEQVAILYQHFKNHALLYQSSPFNQYFERQTYPERYDYLRAALHDVGKYLILYEVLAFEGDFRETIPTEQKYREQMNLHAPISYYILGAFGEHAAELAGYHHQFHHYTDEKQWQSMREKDPYLRAAYPVFDQPVTIPEEAKILQVLDTAEGICHRRGYKSNEKNTTPYVKKRPLRTIAEMLPILAIEAKAGVLDPLVVREVLEHRLYEPLLKFPSTTLSHNPDIAPKPEVNQNPWESLSNKEKWYILEEEPITFRYGKHQVEAKGIEGVRDILLDDLELARLADDRKNPFGQVTTWKMKTSRRKAPEHGATQDRS